MGMLSQHVHRVWHRMHCVAHCVHRMRRIIPNYAIFTNFHQCQSENQLSLHFFLAGFQQIGQFLAIFGPPLATFSHLEQHLQFRPLWLFACILYHFPPILAAFCRFCAFVAISGYFTLLLGHFFWPHLAILWLLAQMQWLLVQNVPNQSNFGLKTTKNYQCHPECYVAAILESMGPFAGVFLSRNHFRLYLSRGAMWCTQCRMRCLQCRTRCRTRSVAEASPMGWNWNVLSKGYFDFPAIPRNMAILNPNNNTFWAQKSRIPTRLLTGLPCRRKTFASSAHITMKQVKCSAVHKTWSNQPPHLPIYCALDQISKWRSTSPMYSVRNKLTRLISKLGCSGCFHTAGTSQCFRSSIPWATGVTLKVTERRPPPQFSLHPGFWFVSGWGKLDAWIKLADQNPSNFLQRFPIRQWGQIWCLKSSKSPGLIHKHVCCQKLSLFMWKSLICTMHMFCDPLITLTANFFLDSRPCKELRENKSMVRYSVLKDSFNIQKYSSVSLLFSRYYNRFCRLGWTRN